MQVTYRKAESGEDAARDASSADAAPIHATGDRAVLRKESGVATFYGTRAQRARLWQGGSQVEAPVLVFGKDDATLDAYGTGTETMPVRTVLVSKAAGQRQDGVTDSLAGGFRRKAQVLRVQSGRLHYADAARRAEFSRGVVLEDTDGTMSRAGRRWRRFCRPGSQRAPGRWRRRKRVCRGLPAELWTA